VTTDLHGDALRNASTDVVAARGPAEIVEQLALVFFLFAPLSSSSII